MKKGDFVHLFGKVKMNIGKDGKVYTSLKIYSAKLLKVKEQTKDSTIRKLKEFKNKRISKSRLRVIRTRVLKDKLKI